MHHNIKFGDKMFGSLEDVIWKNTDILTLHCDLDLECSNPYFFYKTLAYDHVSSDQVWLSRNQNSSEDIVERVIYIKIMSPCCDLDLDDNKQIFCLHNILAHGAASPYQVWSQNVLQFRRYHLVKQLTYWTLTVTLTLKVAIQFFHRTLQLLMLYYETKFGNKQTRSLEDTAEIVIFWL